MTASGHAIFAGWVVGCATLVAIGVLTQSIFAWLGCVIAAAATALTLLGVAQAPEPTIAEIIRDAQ